MARPREKRLPRSMLTKKGYLRKKYMDRNGVYNDRFYKRLGLRPSKR